MRYIFGVIYCIHLDILYPNKITNYMKNNQDPGPTSGSPENHDNASCNSVRFWVHSYEMKTWNAASAMAYFLLYFRFAKSLRLHLVAI